MLLRKWNYETRQYEPYSISDEWDCRYYDDNMSKIINCCQCGKEITIGNGYSSLEVHTLMGFGYMVCGDCHKEEVERKNNKETERKL